MFLNIYQLTLTCLWPPRTDFVALKVLERALNFVLTNVYYEPCKFISLPPGGPVAALEVNPVQLRRLRIVWLLHDPRIYSDLGGLGHTVMESVHHLVWLPVVTASILGIKIWWTGHHDNGASWQLLLMTPPVWGWWQVFRFMEKEMYYAQLRIKFAHIRLYVYYSVIYVHRSLSVRHNVCHIVLCWCQGKYPTPPAFTQHSASFTFRFTYMRTGSWRTGVEGTSFVTTRTN